MRRKFTHFLSIILAIFLSFLTSLVYAQIPAQQEAGGVENLRRLEEQEEQLRIKIQEVPSPPPMSVIEQPAYPQPPESDSILVNTITTSGITLLSEAEIDEIIVPFQGKELNLREMQNIANMITDAYREKGYITSRAILPPQNIKNRILQINVIEGRMGQYEVQGNEHFESSLFKKRMYLKEGELFNYEKMRKSLSKINQFPDRNVRAVIAPGKKPGTTDVVLEVKDQLPIHLDLSWDNYASRFLGKDRYQAMLTHNNLLGFDDTLTYQYRLAEADAYELNLVRYLFPFNDKTSLGLFWAKADIELGDEFSSLSARGKSKLYSLYLTHELIDTKNLTLSLNLGYDYKDIFNFQLGSETSRDRLRVFTTGIKVDNSDKYGRTIFNSKIDTGVPNMFGGLDSVDSKSSRLGSGGKFIKNTIDLLRLQNLVWGATLLLKTQAQFSSRILPAAEQYQIGGIINVRGYPPGEFVGDSGQSITGEFTIPAYIFPKIKIPFTEITFYDATKIALFYDWGRVELRGPQAGESERKVLRSAGTGLGFNLPNDFVIRVDIAWPLDETPSDGDNVHAWFKVSKKF